MADHTKIEWTDATWNPITGCAVVSPGCKNCYAMRLAGTRLQHHPSRAGLTTMVKAGPAWTGETRLNEKWLTQPLQWSRPRRIFVCAHGDLFAESVPDAWIDRVFGVMALAERHTFQVLTKRAKRMREYASRVAACGEHWLAHIPDAPPARWPLPNVWLGVSAEDQSTAENLVPHLLETSAAVRWLSAEPLLGPIDFDDFRPANSPTRGDPFPLTGRMIWAAARGFDDSVNACAGYTGKLDWVVVGGESGPGARPMHPAWVRYIRDQCERAGVPFFFKQWGEWGDRVDAIHVSRESAIWRDGYASKTSKTALALDALRAGGCVVQRMGKARAGRMLDGEAHDDMPEAAR